MIKNLRIKTRIMKIRNGVEFFYKNPVHGRYEVHSEVFVVIYYLVPLINLSMHDENCHKFECHGVSENEQVQSGNVG